MQERYIDRNLTDSTSVLFDAGDFSHEQYGSRFEQTCETGDIVDFSHF